VSAVPPLTPYDPSWPAWFARVRDELTPLLAPWATTPVEHIGSTSIRDMPAKPVLDLMVGVRDLAAAAQGAEFLRGHGWQRRPHRVDAELVIDVRDGLDSVHLHLTRPGSGLWRERLAFRDALRRDPSLAAEYARLKWQLQAANGGRPYDSRDKEGFVQRVLVAAGIDLDANRHSTARKPPGVSIPSWVEHQIRTAQAKGAFDDLPGKGKPIADLDQPQAELAWVANYLRRENVDAAALLPPSLALAKEVEVLAERIGNIRSEAEVRRLVDDLNKRITRARALPAEGPPMRVKLVDPEATVSEWRQRTAESTRPSAVPSAESAGPAPRRRLFRRRSRR
jgi:GrpB-like predicted nucleotidyltransferase (UPF0157 family)